MVVWEDRALADLKDSTTNATYLDAAGLGLPDRDYYVKPDFKDKLESYRLHVGKLLGLLAPPGAAPAKPDSAAADVVAIETELAKLTKTDVERRDIPAAYNPTDIKGLAQKTRSVDWRAYFTAVGFQPTELVLGTPKCFGALGKLRAKFKSAQWAGPTVSPALHCGVHFRRRLQREAFELQKRGRESSATAASAASMRRRRRSAKLLSQQTQQSTFRSSSKQTATKLVERSSKGDGASVASSGWPTRPSRSSREAGEDRCMIGTTKWRTYD
jgi:putative endopeptidase